MNRIECKELEETGRDTDLQYQFPTRKTDYSWFHARLRLSMKAIQREFGGQSVLEFCSKAGFVSHDETKCVFCDGKSQEPFGIATCSTCREIINFAIDNKTKAHRPFRVTA